MVTNVRTSRLRKGDVITENARSLKVRDIVWTDITYRGKPVEVLTLLCTDGEGRRVRRTVTGRETCAVLR